MSPEEIANVKKLISPISMTARMATARGSVERVRDNSKIQTVQITLLDEEVRDRVERLQNYGLSSNPPEGSDAAVIFIGGNRDHGIIIAVDSREYRKKNLAPGEVCIYDKNGSEILLSSGRKIEIKSDLGLEVTINGIKTTIDSSGIVTQGDISDNLGTLDALRQRVTELEQRYNIHAHGVVALPVSTTTPPNN
jgi:phage baseplate assembly protein V